MRQPSSAVSSSASMPSENGQIASARLRHSRPSDDRSQTVAHDTTGPQHADRRPSRLFSSGVVDGSHTTALERLEIQLHDVTTAFATSDINHSANIMQTMGKLGDIIETYGRDNHINRNMGDVINYTKRLGSAERAARELLRGLDDLLVPPINLTEGSFHTPSDHTLLTMPGAPTTTPSSPPAMTAQDTSLRVSTDPQPASDTAGSQRNGLMMPSMYPSRTGSTSRAIPTKAASWPASNAVSAIPPLLAAFTDLAVTGQVLYRERATLDDPTSRSAAIRIERAQVIDRLIDTTAYRADLSKDAHVLQLCDELLRCSKEGLSTLLDQGTNLYKSSDALDIFHSTVCRNADALYTIMAAAATIASAFAQNMESGTAAIMIGGAGGVLQAGVDYLGRTTVGPSPTNTLSAVTSALRTIGDLKYAAQLLLLSYVELEEIIREILALRQGAFAFHSVDKARIAQFFYSFGRHFDIMTGKSVETVCEEERRRLENSCQINPGTIADVHQATRARDRSQGSGLPVYHRNGTGRVTTSDDLRHR
ncbi:hypothetical protein BD626DRAFT_62571 [Schizophyllum amplum]|uniref:Uncharacterized protein n=1 Tax=Schizophyllum amplum TaxID=97359 RepID=A0A550BSF5_9AGAR|nr:hypothetical protein BD626DRAFT_62571 [Auriculariopsis ampla]